jgi:hypothetical protein
MEVSGQLHASAALSPAKEPVVSIGYEGLEVNVYTKWSLKLSRSVVICNKSLENFSRLSIAEQYYEIDMKLLFSSKTVYTEQQ